MVVMAVDGGNGGSGGNADGTSTADKWMELQVRTDINVASGSGVAPYPRFQGGSGDSGTVWNGDDRAYTVAFGNDNDKGGRMWVKKSDELKWDDLHTVQEVFDKATGDPERTFGAVSVSASASAARNKKKKTSTGKRKAPPQENDDEYTPAETETINTAKEYQDRSHEVVAGPSTTFSSTCGGVREVDQFPHRLHLLLAQIEADGLSDVVGFQPHGRSFLVRDHERFSAEVLPKYFQMSKEQSFKRQLQLYGFSRLFNNGPDRGKLCVLIVCFVLHSAHQPCGMVVEVGHVFISRLQCLTRSMPTHCRRNVLCCYNQLLLQYRRILPRIFSKGQAITNSQNSSQNNQGPRPSGQQS